MCSKCVENRSNDYGAEAGAHVHSLWRGRPFKLLWHTLDGRCAIMDQWPTFQAPTLKSEWEERNLDQGTCKCTSTGRGGTPLVCLEGHTSHPDETRGGRQGAGRSNNRWKAGRLRATAQCALRAQGCCTTIAQLLYLRCTSAKPPTSGTSLEACFFECMWRPRYMLCPQPELQRLHM